MSYSCLLFLACIQNIQRRFFIECQGVIESILHATTDLFIHIPVSKNLFFLGLSWMQII